MDWCSVFQHVDAELVQVGMKTELNAKSKSFDLLVPPSRIPDELCHHELWSS